MLLSLLALGMVVYVAYAMIFLSGPDGEEKCVAVEYIMEGDEESKFIDESDMENMLKDAHVYPKGMLMKDVNTKKIEGFTKVFTDSAGNLWIQTGDGEFVIYNPDGIVGLTALKGKLTKNELPKEED